MLQNTILELVNEKLNEGVGNYYRSPNDFHNEMIKNAKKSEQLNSELSKLKSSGTAAQLRSLKSKIGSTESDSHDLVDGADHHHGKGMGDAIRYHAYVAMHPIENGVDRYNQPNHAAFRETHGIKVDSNLSKKQTTPTPTPNNKPEPKTKKQKNNKSGLIQTLLKGTALLKLINWNKDRK